MTAFAIEALVLVAMSVIWYASIAHLVLSRRATMKRPAVVIVMFAAILVGMSSKLGAVAETGELDPLFWLHAMNLLIVFVDLRLTAIYARTDVRLRSPDDRPPARIPSVAAVVDRTPA